MNGLGALAGLFTSAMNAGASQYSNPQIAAIGQQSQNAASTNLQGAQVMQQTIKDFKDHKITTDQMLDVYDQLKAAGAAGGPMDIMDKVLWRASHARQIGHKHDIGLEVGVGLQKYGDAALAPLPSLASVNTTAASTGSQIAY